MEDDDDDDNYNLHKNFRLEFRGKEMKGERNLRPTAVPCHLLPSHANPAPPLLNSPFLLSRWRTYAKWKWDSSSLFFAAITVTRPPTKNQDDFQP